MNSIKLVFNVIKGWLLPWTSPFEEVTDSILKSLNSFLKAEKVSANVQKARSYVGKALELLRKYANWCPAPWRNEFDAITGLVEDLSETLADDRIDTAELAKLITAFKDAYAKWQED